MKSRSFKNIRINSMYCIIYTLLLCVFGYPLIINAKSAEIVDRIVAVVNDEVITLIELNSSLKPYKEKLDLLDIRRRKSKNYSLKSERICLTALSIRKLKIRR